jgi:hypothetical protein
MAAVPVVRKLLIGGAVVSLVWFILIITHLNDLGASEQGHRILLHPRNLHGNDLESVDSSPRPQNVSPTSHQVDLPPEVEVLTHNHLNHHNTATAKRIQESSIYDKYFVNKTEVPRGRPLTRDEFLDLEDGMKRHSFNVSASERIPLDRPLPDLRPKQ